MFGNTVAHLVCGGWSLAGALVVWLFHRETLTDAVREKTEKRVTTVLSY